MVDPDKIVVSFTNNDQGITESYEQDSELSYTIANINFLFKQTGTETKPRVDGTNNTVYARVYNGNTLTITAPEGMSFKTIDFNFNKGTLKEGTDSYNKNNSKWSGDAHSVTFSCTDNCFIVSVAFTYVTESVAITSAKYATYCSTNALAFGTTDVKVYKAKADGSVVKLTEIEDGIVPANTGVILYCETAGSYSIPVTTTEATVSDNELVGTTARELVKKTDGTKFNYILQQSGDDIVFNMATDAGAYMPANRAYLSTTVNAAAARLGVVFGDETVGIESSSVFSQSDDAVYNLQGVRFGSEQHNALRRGIYVKNGKKFVVK